MYILVYMLKSQNNWKKLNIEGNFAFFSKQNKSLFKNFRLVKDKWN